MIICRFVLFTIRSQVSVQDEVDQKSQAICAFQGFQPSKGFHVGDARVKNSDAAQPRVTNVKTPSLKQSCI